MISEDQVKELETKHGRVAHLKGYGSPPPWELVLRKPSRQEYRAFRAKSHNPQTLPDAQEDLVRCCSVLPPRGPDLDALLEEWPGIPEAAGKAITRLTGMAVSDDNF